MLEAALWLGAEAVGMGYLHATGEATGWFSHALGPLLAERLPVRSPRAALEDLAQLWNLSEGLERSAPWLRALFSHFRHRLLPELSVEAFVHGLDAAVGDEGLVALGDDASRWTTAWLPAGPLPGDVLPGRIVFLAPRVVAVEHRGLGQASFYFLQPSPLPLGTGPLPELPAPGPRSHANGRAGLLAFCRAGALHADATSPFAWVGSPELSQRVLFAWRAA